MKELLQDEPYDARICPSDWRYSAAIVGMLRYFDYFEPHLSYDIKEDDQGIEWLYYRMEDIDGEKARHQYFQFVEYFFEDYMHHKVLERLLEKDSLTEEEEKLFNDKLCANTICKKYFGKLKFSLDSKKEIQQIIDDNRETLICETFRNSPSMYRKFANTNKLGEPSGDICRLVGYYAQVSRKGKSLAYRWDYGTYVAHDEPEFDFIPFAFSKSRDGFFINNNYTIKNLKKSNDMLNQAIQTGQSKNPRIYLFRCVKESTSFLDYEVEVIHKSQEQEVFESLYVRKSAIKIFKKITENVFSAIERPCKFGKDDYFPMLETVTDRVINQIHLDDVIETVFHWNQEGEKSYLIRQLIIINQFIYDDCYYYGGKDMQKKTNWARATANDVRKILMAKGADNKVKSYQQKLISAITFKDYDRFCEILLQLSSYVELPFDFAYDLFDDFEQNKNMAYAFVEGLQEKNKTQQSNEEQ